ncbi:protein bcp1, putative [Entamoeba invadens IP1]|uniref:Protein bcp1, putative n=1 Tax=Entamoeba invadens IP1 TaxID=370355 RepID=A0A0A1UGG6_ENTIV|nr:protein bcp1, putative [Entamoeba invadens IP1]ELP92647.1 protein bcp1, putative [Entamoeba invadens IP1]|eukprot:XP_004259418.1 protein bcp1, putative [Entamoeba invadens IP1]
MSNPITRKSKRMKRRANAMEEEDEKFSDDENNMDPNAMEEINVDLFLENQSQNDYSEIVNFLIHSSLKYVGMNLYALTDVLLTTECGSIIKTETDKYGIAIPLELQKMPSDIVSPLSHFITETFKTRCPEKLQLVQNVLSGADGRTVFIVNERLVNCPYDLTSLLHNTIYEEIGIYDKEHNITEPVKHFILLASAVIGVDNGEEDDDDGAMKRKKKKVSNSQQLEYVLMENEVYAKYAEAIATVKTPGKDRWTLPGKVSDFTSVIIINRDNVQKILDEIALLFGVSKFEEQN